MATLAIAAAGALFGGSAAGAAIGLTASSGWLIGSIIGTLLFPPSGISTEGPRLGDLTVTSSAYGMPIGIIFGTIRTSGNMIWSTGIEEVSNTKKQGGKGGGGAKSTSYTYFASFALGACEGEADDVLRMWADGKLIYDKTSDSDDIIKAGLEFRFYPGSEIQEPDSLIEDDKGVDTTPAFRGLCYIVFERLPLIDFGNRIPNITMEITFNANPAMPVQTLDLFLDSEGGISTDMGNAIFSMGIDYDRGVGYFSGDNSAPDTVVLRRFNTRTMVEDRQFEYDEDVNMATVDQLKIRTVMPSGTIVAATTGNIADDAISVINPDTLEIYDSLISADQPRTSIDTNASWIQLLHPIVGLQEYFITAGRIPPAVIHVYAVGPQAIDYVWDSTSAPTKPAFPVASNSVVLSVTHGATGDNFGEAYVIAGNRYLASSSDDLHIYTVTAGSNASFDDTGVDPIFTGIGIELTATLAPGDFFPGDTELETVGASVYDATDDTIMFWVERELVATRHLVKFNPRTASIVWVSEPLPVIANTMHVGINQSRVENGIFAGQATTSETGWAVYTNSGELFYDEDGWSRGAFTTSPWIWDSRASSVISYSVAISGPIDVNISKWLYFRGSGQGTDLAAIVSNLSQRGGLAVSDLNVTDLAGKIVPGYLISRQTTIRGALQPLASVWFFDGVESDYVLKYLLREGKSVAATIPERDLAAQGESASGSGDFFNENRIQEVELPMRFNLTYMDKDKDYVQATHNARRILGPTPPGTMNSRNEIGIEVPIALAADVAKQSAEQSLYSSWIERSSYSLRTSWEYLALDPTDLVTFSLDSGTTFRTRLVQTDVGLGFSIDMSALSEDAAQYTATVEADGGSSGLVQEFLSTPATKLIMLCSPLLRDSDDSGRTVSTLYFLMGGFGQPNWNAGLLFKSVEGTEYVEVGSSVSEMAWGTAATALGDVTDPFQTDEVNSVKVFMNVGASELSSVTQLEMLNGANPAALIHANGVDVEIIQFRDVLVGGDGSLTLSGLLRGRRGTDTFTGGHIAGDTFVLLNGSDLGAIPLTIGEQDLTRYYKGVTSGLLLEDANTLVKASPLNDLKPYAVVQHKAELQVGDDIDLTWQRRTRLGGELKDGTGDVPLNEDSEEYEVEILDAPGGSIVRTVLALSSTAYTYTSADQTTDGFSPPISSITLQIYQISAQAGRGFVKEVEINVE